MNSRRRTLKRWKALESERSTHLQHWRVLADNFHPRRGRWLAKDKSQPQRNGNIINSTPLHALRVLVSGMMAGITSPSRPWFRLTTPDPRVAESGAVKGWLHDVEETMRLMLARSNLYNCLHLVYAYLAVPGVAALHIEEDPEDLVRGYVFPIGSFALANSERLQIDSVYRETTLSTAQLVEKFGLDACSDRVRALWERGDFDTEHQVLHVVEPNRKHEPGKLGARGKKYRSVWLELAAGDEAGFLREAGFDEFPIMAPRWEADGESAYASSSPGMEALPECRALQLLERRKAQLVEKIVEPPMVGPSHLATKGGVNLLPGAFTAIDASQLGMKAEPAFVPNPQALSGINAEIAESERRIHAMLFADLWLSLTGQDGQMTAREVQERHDEKMMQLGPALERMQDELLDPLIDRIFALGLRSGAFPPPPPELQGMDLRVEYISMLAQAQKLLGTRSIEQLTAYVMNVASVDPEVLDGFDHEAALRAMHDALGAPPDLIRSPEDVQARRQARADAAAQQQQTESMAAEAQAAKNLAGADMGGNNALAAMLAGLGAGGAQA